MLQQEPVEERDRMITAMLAPLGLEKGKKFQPNERQIKLLTEGALIGELMSMNISYAKRFENSYYRPDTKWAYVIMFDPSQESKITVNRFKKHRPLRMVFFAILRI